MNKRGRFIVLEGLEGAGKSTAIETIRRFLLPRVPELVTTREPGGTYVGEAIRQLVKTTIPDQPLDSRAELLLFYAARVQLLNCVILPALARGAWVLANRFELSTYAYQGHGRKLDLKMIQQLSMFCLHDVQPDLILFLDLKPEQGLARARQRGQHDRIEEESLAFFDDVYAGYHQHLTRFEHVRLVDASLPLEMVQQRILDTLEDYVATHG